MNNIGQNFPTQPQIFVNKISEPQKQEQPIFKTRIYEAHAPIPDDMEPGLTQK